METQHRARPRSVVLISIPVTLAVAVAALAFAVNEQSLPLPPSPPAQPLSAAQPGPASFGWRLTRAMAAHRGLVLEVETTRPAEALLIAQRLTELYQDRYDEVLVFIFEPGVTPRRALERVQWTRAHGYRTLTLRTRP